jgi:hypothetical protein
MNDLLESARRETVAVLSSVAIADAIAEPALRTADGAIAYDSEGMRTPVRKDVARKEDGAWVTANVDAPKITPAAPLRLVWKNRLHVTIATITWDYVAFRLAPVGSQRDLGEIRKWFLRWFDPEDLLQKTEEGLFGVVHFVSNPETRDGATELIVDFGSAPVQAFEELLDCFADAGFTACEVR